MSRTLDYLAAHPGVDARRVVVFGHSRHGKAALGAGAQDERFALVISNNSGEGGAALTRRNFGENIAYSIAHASWRYCDRFRDYMAALLFYYADHRRGVRDPKGKIVADRWQIVVAFAGFRCGRATRPTGSFSSPAIPVPARPRA